MLIRRTRKPAAFKGYTDAEGFKTADAPDHWPFGKTRKPATTAVPKGHARHRAVSTLATDTRPPSLALTERRDRNPLEGEDAPW